MSSEVALLPCPFCGGEATYTGTNRWRGGLPLRLVTCRECGSCGRDDLWNHRQQAEARATSVVVKAAFEQGFGSGVGAMEAETGASISGAVEDQVMSEAWDAYAADISASTTEAPGEGAGS